MRTYRFMTLVMALLLTALSASAQRKIQVALLLDTSGSMDGLIEQAKSQLWSIVNEMALAKAEGQAPDIEIALYEYGNDGISYSQNYIRQIVPLSKDLDKISEALFALRTNGGSEFCGAAIGKSMDELAWSSSNRDLKMIYIASNEPFNQGGVDYKEMCKKAISKGIVVNTIFCGDKNEGIRTFWKDGADLGEGKYFNIDHNQQPIVVNTPYDQKLNELNNKLNQTYIGYGAEGEAHKRAQAKQDGNAAAQSPAVAAERTVSKSTGAYRADDWDLVDAVKNNKVAVEDLKTTDLPAELKDKSKEEIKVYVAQKEAERTQIQTEIQSLNQQRTVFVQEELKKQGNDNSLNAAMNAAMRENAIKQGFTFSK